MAKDKDQYEKDIQSVIRYLEQTDPDNATRDKAIEMLNDMHSMAHLIAHKIVDDHQDNLIKRKN